MNTAVLKATAEKLTLFKGKGELFIAALHDYVKEFAFFTDTSGDSTSFTTRFFGATIRVRVELAIGAPLGSVVAYHVLDPNTPPVKLVTFVFDDSGNIFLGETQTAGVDHAADAAPKFFGQVLAVLKGRSTILAP